MLPRLPRSPLRLLLAAAFVAGFVASGPSAVGPRVASASQPLPRITFVAPRGTTILVHGTYPKVPSPCRQPVQPLLHARYPGIIEVGKDTDGTLFVIGELSFEEYLKGIAEVPRTWPMAALEAQAVAARTYALSHLESSDPTGARLGYQLCATDQCQVYRGDGVAGGPYGTRWVKAVDATAGKALLYQGRPADAFYFSTSNGRTYPNQDIFGGSPLPYLQGTTERNDGASPLSHWSTSMPFADVARFLSAAGAWPGGTKVTGVSQHGSNVTVSGTKTSRTLRAVDFRIDLNAWAHCLDPGHYPTGSLPQAVPSRWFDLHTSGGAMTLDGRGWGHGVGMVQWGAYGKAADGWSYGDILAAYYGGLRPRSAHEPKTIRVGIATGLKTLEVVPSGPVTVLGRTLGPGPWTITGGKHLRAHHGASPPSYVPAGSLVAPGSASSGETRHATVTVLETSVVHLSFSGAGTDLPVTKDRTVETGSLRLAWTVPSVASGTYRLQAVVSDGIDIVRSKGARIRVAGVAATPSAPAPPSPSATSVTPVATTTPAGHGSGTSTIIFIGSLALAVVIAAVSVTFLYRRLGGGPTRPEPFEPDREP